MAEIGTFLFYECNIYKIKINSLEEENFKKIIEKMNKNFSEIKYSNGDISDIGNEIGIAIGEHLSESDDLNSFISGLKHGISLKNGTH